MHVCRVQVYWLLSRLSLPYKTPVISFPRDDVHSIKSIFGAPTMNTTHSHYRELPQTSSLIPDRTANIRFWHLLERVFTWSRKYAPQDFRFVVGATPMSTWTEVLAVLATYYAVIFGGRELMRNQKPLRLDFLFKLHNLGLSIVSGFVLILFIEQLVPMLQDKGLLHGICRQTGGWSDKLVVLYYVSEQ
jgi:hypothetical protein